MDNAPESTASDTTLLGGFAPSESPQESAAPAKEEGHAQQPANTESWFGAYSEETQSLITNRGYDKIDQTQAFEDLANGYKNLQTKLGGNHDELYKITGEMTPEDRVGVYNALGRPETVEGYTYQPQEGDHPELVQHFKNVSHELGLSESQVSKMIPALNEQIVSLAQAQEQEVQAQNNAGLEALQKEWAGAWDSKLNLATRAAEHFGITEDMQKAIVAGGYSADFIKALNGIGGLMAEGAMVGMSPSDGKAHMGVMSKDEAQSQLSAKQGDPDFQARLRSADRKVAEHASQELEKYYKILASK
ncbi:coil containing protein [Vibrio phage 1.182.O._10N.286.46.E1]|nr:coil containing protein [Vibrio phage 1.182.O._10N.286.46.E1]